MVKPLMMSARLRRSTGTTAALVVLVCLVGGSYLLGTAGRARQKLFWHDEIVALTLASLPPRQLWAGLLDGTDLNPPLYHLVLRGWHTVAGQGPVASRVPSIAALALAAVATAVFVGRSLGPLAGLTAALILLGTEAYRYAYEARPYAFVLGFGAASLVCWQAAARGHAGRGWWLLGLLVCAAATVATHYYAILVIAALSVGEIARTMETRRVDWRIAAVLAVSLVPLALCWPLIRVARSFSVGYFGKPGVTAMFQAYESVLLDLIVPFTIAIGLVLATLLVFRPAGARPLETTTPPRPETATALALLAAPFVGYLAAVLVTGAFVTRYFLVATLGISILVPHLVAYMERHGKVVMLSLAGVLLVFLGLRDLSSARLLLRPLPDLSLVHPSVLSAAGGTLPLVITNGHVYAMVVHYAPRGVTSRAFYLYRPESLRTGAEPRYIMGLSRWNTAFQPRELEPFLREHPRFLLYGPTPGGLLSEIRRRHGVAVLRAIDVDESLFAVSRPGPSSLFEISLPGAAEGPGETRPDTR